MCPKKSIRQPTNRIDALLLSSADTHLCVNCVGCTSGNTRFIQFGRKYKAFAKVVPSGKTVICALQMAKKHLALLVAFR
jgi:hypothetical protein